MSMDDRRGARQANPWSFMRGRIFPLVESAVWSRVWIGWWVSHLFSVLTLGLGQFAMFNIALDAKLVSLLNVAF